MDATLAQRNARYLEETVATAPPSKLLTMLYDRLLRDLTTARRAQLDGDVATRQHNLAHAREILTELLTSLDGTVWSGAGGLAQLYSWLLTQLIQADVRGDEAQIGSCASLVDELRRAWHEAAGQLAPEALPA